MSHPDSDCRRAACGLIGTACQNNPKMQSAFLPSLSELFQIVCNEVDEKDTRIKALFAISCECCYSRVELLLVIFRSCYRQEVFQCCLQTGSIYVGVFIKQVLVRYVIGRFCLGVVAL